MFKTMFRVVLTEVLPVSIVLVRGEVSHNLIIQLSHVYFAGDGLELVLPLHARHRLQHLPQLPLPSIFTACLAILT